MHEHHEQADMRRKEDRGRSIFGLAFDQRMQAAYQVQFLLRYSVKVHDPGCGDFNQPCERTKRR
jgi:hypothetical protein